MRQHRDDCVARRNRRKGDRHRDFLDRQDVTEGSHDIDCEPDHRKRIEKLCNDRCEISAADFSVIAQPAGGDEVSASAMTIAPAKAPSPLRINPVIVLTRSGITEKLTNMLAHSRMRRRRV